MKACRANFSLLSFGEFSCWDRGSLILGVPYLARSIKSETLPSETRFFHDAFRVFDTSVFNPQIPFQVLILHAVMSTDFAQLIRP